MELSPSRLEPWCRLRERSFRDSDPESKQRTAGRKAKTAVAEEEASPLDEVETHSVDDVV